MKTLIWETHDGGAHPTSPAEILADNRGDEGVADALAYLKTETKKRSFMWAGVRFGGGAAGDTCITVRLAGARVAPEHEIMGYCLHESDVPRRSGTRTGNPSAPPTQEQASIIAHVIHTLTQLELLAQKQNDTKTGAAAWDKLARKLIMLQISLNIPYEARIPETSDYRDRFAWRRRFAIACDSAQAEGRHPWWYGGPIPRSGTRTSNPAASRIPAGFVLLGGGEGKYPYTLIYTKPLGHKGANYYPFVLLGDDGRGLVSSWDEGDFRSLKSQGYSASGHKVSLSQLPAAVRSAVAHYIEELPLRAAARPPQGRTGNPPASPFVLLDAGPRESDRYTLICTTPQGSGSRSYYNYLGFGTGVSGHGEFTASDFRAFKAEGYRSLGKRIKIESLPASFHRLAERFMAECG